MNNGPTDNPPACTCVPPECTCLAFLDILEANYTIAEEVALRRIAGSNPRTAKPIRPKPRRQE